MSEQRFAVVTGAARGIGRAIVLELLNQGRKVAGLDLNKGQVFRPGIFDSVDSLSLDINRLSGAKHNFIVANRQHSLTTQNKPVLIPVLVALQAQSFAWIYDNPFVFISIFISKHLVKPPWPMVLTVF